MTVCDTIYMYVLSFTNDKLIENITRVSYLLLINRNAKLQGAKCILKYFLECVTDVLGTLR